LFLEKQSDTEHILECTPRLYTCERWGNSFRVRTKAIQNYQSIKREIVTCSSLFDRERELNEESNWVCTIKITIINYCKLKLFFL